MSAQIPENKLVSELLKPTGFNCPDDLQGKTFNEATSGGDAPELIDLTVTANNVYTPAEGKAYKKVSVNVPAPTVKLYCWIGVDMPNMRWTNVEHPSNPFSMYVAGPETLTKETVTDAIIKTSTIEIYGYEYKRHPDGDITVA